MVVDTKGRDGRELPPPSALALTRQMLLSEFGVDSTSAPTIEMGPPAELKDGAPIVYLDTNHWIALSKARVGHPDGRRLVPCYQLLKSAVETGELCLVMSSATYMEHSLAITNVRQRTDLADVISELTRFRSIRLRSELLDAEVIQALHDRFGRPMFPDRLVVIGKGVGWAFGGHEITLRLEGTPEELEEFKSVVDEQTLSQLKQLGSESMEYLVLRGARPEDIKRMSGYDLSPVRKVELDRLNREIDLQDQLKADPTWESKLDDIIMARALYWELAPQLPQLLMRAGMSMDSFLARGKEWLTEFVLDLPIIAVQVAIRRQLLKNATRRWEVNDIRDLDHLSVAVPYCDIVVTEVFAADTLKRSKLDQKYNTKILTKLGDLAKLIDP